MDDRSGQLYPSLAKALEAGVPQENAVEIDVVELAAGPFKGRKYVRKADGSLGRRVYDNAREMK